MAEWLKVIVGVITGIGIGVMSEPLKRMAGTTYMTWRAEKAIYWELASLYAVFCLDNKRVGNTVHVYVGPEFKSERFDYYYAEHREALFGIPTWNGIQKIYETFRLTKTQADSYEISDAEGAERLEREFSTCLTWV